MDNQKRAESTRLGALVTEYEAHHDDLFDKVRISGYIRERVLFLATQLKGKGWGEASELLCEEFGIKHPSSEF